MTLVSKVALAALLAGTPALVAQPAFAKEKKKEEAAQPGLKLSNEFRTPAAAAQTAIAAKDFVTAEPALAQLDALAKSDDEKYVAAALRYDLVSQRLFAQQTANPKAPIDETVLAAPLDALIANPATPAEMRPKYAYRRGVLSFNSRQWPQALQYLNQAKQLGYTDPDLQLQIMQVKMQSGDVRGGLTDLEAAVAQAEASGQKAPENYYKMGISRSNSAKLPAETMKWLQKWIVAYPSKGNWRDVVVAFGLQQNPIATVDKAQKIDLFRLMRASGSLADQYDYTEYAQYVFDRGLPFEAQAVLKEGVSGGKLSATNTEVKALTAQAANSIRNEGPLAAAETRARAAANGKLAASTADVYLGQDNFAKAADLYRAALTKGGVDGDEVNTHLGIALARQGDKEGAKAAFANVKGATRAQIAALWSTWMETPRA